MVGSSCCFVCVVCLGCLGCSFTCGCVQWSREERPHAFHHLHFHPKCLWDHKDIREDDCSIQREPAITHPCSVERMFSVRQFASWHTPCVNRGLNGRERRYVCACARACARVVVVVVVCVRVCVERGSLSSFLLITNKTPHLPSVKGAGIPFVLPLERLVTYSTGTEGGGVIVVYRTVQVVEVSLCMQARASCTL